MWKKWQAQKESGKSSAVKVRAVIAFVFYALFARCLHSNFPKQIFTFRTRDQFPQIKETLRILRPTESRTQHLKNGPKPLRLDFKCGVWISWANAFVLLWYKSRGKKVKILTVLVHTAFNFLKMKGVL